MSLTTFLAFVMAALQETPSLVAGVEQIISDLKASGQGSEPMTPEVTQAMASLYAKLKAAQPAS